MKLSSVFAILTLNTVMLGVSTASQADTCSGLVSATELSSVCVPGAAATCELTAATTYKISADSGTAASPLPPIIVPAESAICITNTVLSGAVDIFAQSVWLQGGTLQIGTATDPITAENKVTITMTGVNGAAKAPLPICAAGGSTRDCSPIATASYTTPNARDITVSGGGQLLMYGAKGLVPVAGSPTDYIHSVDYAGGLVDGQPIETDKAGHAVSGDINQAPYFNNLSGSRSWTYLRYPAGPAYFNADIHVQAPVDGSLYGDLLDHLSLGKADTQPAAADAPYLVALSNMVADGQVTDWEAGDWISIATTTFSSHETEIVQICKVFAIANPDTALPEALIGRYGDVTGPEALPNITVLVLAGAPSYKSLCSGYAATPLKHYHFGSEAPTPGFFKTDAPDGYPDAETGQAYSFYDGESRNFGIDERSEVALLSRSIKLTSTAGTASSPAIPNLKDQYFGGHIAVMNHDVSQTQGGHSGHELDTVAAAPDVKVELVGVEIEKFGQPLVGRYPIHFHRLNAVTTTEDSSRLLVQDTVVHHSFNKCYVVHDTMAAQLYNNSCIRSIGQSFYLEDGHNIAGNNFVRNHVAGAMAAALNYDMSQEYVYDGANKIGRNTYWDGDYLAQQSGFNYNPAKVPDTSNSGANTGNYIDSFTPGGFWITTFGAQAASVAYPNLFVNNSVAGCQLGGSAYWLVRQDIDDIGSVPSKVEADLYPVFTGNRGHACYNGVMAGTNFAVVKTTAAPGAPPKPVPVSADVNTSAQAPVVIFDSMTMTQIENKAFWYRGVFIGVTNSRFSALKQGMTLLGGGGPEGNLLGFWGLVYNSSFAGVTNNNVGRYSDCEGYYEQIANGGVTVTDKTALPLATFNEMAKCAPIDMASVSVSPTTPLTNNSALFGAIVPNFNFQGYTFYDGPARMEDNRFVNFRADPTNWAPYDNAQNSYSTSSPRYLVTKVDAHRMLNYSMAGQFADSSFQWGADEYFGAEGDAAFSWLKGNAQSVPPTQYAKGNRWDNVNFKHQVFTEVSNLQSPLQDGDKQTVEIDRDATLSGYSLCAATSSSTCSTSTANHYPISLNNLNVFQTPYTTDEPHSRGRNNVISTALMSPHKYATVNVGIANQDQIETLTVTRDMPAHAGDAAQTTMSGRGGLKYMYEAMVMNNMGYTYETQNYNADTVGLLFSYSDAPVDTSFINRVGICIGTGATGIKVHKTERQWNSGVNYLAKSPYWTTATYGLTDTSSTCPSVVTDSSAYSTCTANGSAVAAYGSQEDLNENFYTVLNDNYNMTSPVTGYTEGYYYDEASGVLYFNMMQSAEAEGPTKPVTPPFGTCDSANYSGDSGTRAMIADYLKFSDRGNISGALDVACYADTGTPVTSELLTCPVGGCSVYAVGFKMTETAPTCTPSAWAAIGNGAAPGLNSGANAITYSAPYLLYDQATQTPLGTTPVSVVVNGSGGASLTRNSRFVSGGVDSIMPPAADALLPLAKPIYVTNPPPAAQPTIVMNSSNPGNINVLQYGVNPKPTGTIWTLATGASTSAGQTATLSPVAGGKFQKISPPYDQETDISVMPAAGEAAQSFYYSGSTANITIGSAPACPLTFTASSVSGDCTGLTISETTLTVSPPS